MTPQEQELIKKEVTLIDEKNYLLNILEAADETGKSVEDIIQEKIDAIYDELDTNTM